MAKPGEPLPEKVRRPAQDMGIKVAICQTFSIARRYGWALAVGRDDLSCPLAKTAFGFEQVLPYYAEGNLACGMYTATPEAGAQTEAEVPKFALGEFERIIIAPLGRATFEPHVVLVYANAAQVMRLVAAALYQRGGRIHSSFSARLDCADAVIETMHTGRPQVILPCYGDRIYGQTEDHEMAFTVPWAAAVDLVAGLQGTHQGGVRYPIPAWLRYTGEFPEKYRRLRGIPPRSPHGGPRRVREGPPRSHRGHSYSRRHDRQGIISKDAKPG
ncbi:MAG: hypothetical protein E6H02_10640 [Bacillati bacterium ANGP1]|uniref:DUF169 domain-containing protein n=1 Tax=Candidatus Segetimicrobium genomatis TaxID=2569760 RepID=A0A537LJ38_9BACT|nr:MAG: hypothetical protein E6H02_10640 [Terrabacteria group bacterium ANGP1]